VHLPNTPVQPMAAAEIAQQVAEVAVGAPLNGIRNIAGPEKFPLNELGEITLRARGDNREVVVDNEAGMFAAVKGDVLTAPAGAVLGSLHYRDWLKG
jgi:uncharacterized protein YbjT (DUF2867 family)